MSKELPVNLLDLPYARLEAYVCGELNLPRYRAEQLWQWFWYRNCTDFSGMTNISKSLRKELAERTRLFVPEVARTLVSSDSTVKFLLRLDDGNHIETVLIPEKSHYTLCLSTQCGCAMACAFCSTGKLGFTRNMTHGEILGQILVARSYLDAHPEALQLRNLVFMGMGEPLLNIDTMLDVLETLDNPTGLNFSSRRVTVSTVGIQKGIEKLAGNEHCSLAVSLHAPNQELRAQLMPKAAQLHLDDLMACLDNLPLRPRQRITYEYVLLAGINDQPVHVKQLVRLLGQRKAKINLIRFNAPAQDNPVFTSPSEEDAVAFAQRLRDRGQTVTLRKSKGQDIAAACGQLKALHD